MSLDVDARRARVAADALVDAWLYGCAHYWERRAQQLEAARPRRGDFHGQATTEDLKERYDHLTAAAAACRARAAGADGWARGALVETTEDLGMGAAA